MSVTQGESTTRPPVTRALLRVGAAGVVGALVLPFGFTSVVIAGWASGGGAALGVGAAFFAVVTALLVAVASLTGVAPTRGGRVGWALTVAVVGTFGWLFASAVYAEVGTVPFVLGVVPYALVAGLLLPQWYYKLGAIALTVASGIGLLAVLAGDVPDDLDARLAASSLERDEMFVADIPGYHRVPQQRTMAPDDPAVIPAERNVSLYAYPDDPTGDCQPHPSDSVLAGAPCTVEQPGLTYRLGAVSHEYFYRKGTVLLQLVGTLTVDRDVLRDAILTARPTASPGIYTTDIAGFEAAETGPPSGMYFLPTDKTQLPGAMYVEVSASWVPEAPTCVAMYPDCVEERPGLHYHRLTDTHVYFAQHGSLEVRVIGGLGVDRNLLRDAALSARPATDDELMTILPPAPPPPRRTFMDRLKVFANDLFG